ncbi:hypothetical protein [Citrobacter phage Tr1]|nr:hypothetical protein [Citrobacter phage Tr1]
MIIRSSTTLKLFYEAWLQWAFEGGVEGDGEIFTPHAGLCHNFDLWRDTLEDPSDYTPYFEMKSQFVAANLDRCYPFGGERIYDIEGEGHTMHENADRIRWVQDRLNDCERYGVRDINIYSSLDLYEFYVAYDKWATNPQGEDLPEFSAYTGLCSNLWAWCQYVCTDEDIQADLREALAQEMRNQFLKAGVCTTVPFECVGHFYWIEAQNGICNSNPLRLQWVKERLVDGIF